MSNIYPFGQTCQYLLSRAAKNRRSGKYDQAMNLLLKARREYPDNEDVEYELAALYDEIGCEEAAISAYLRIVRIGGKRQASALFQLAVASAQHGDLTRAESYFEAFSSGDRTGVSPEMAELLKRQLASALHPCKRRSRKARAAELEKRAVQQLHAGKLHAAKRNVSHALLLEETPQRLLLKSCCHLMQEEGNSAIKEVNRALLIKPVYVQALCVLVDGYMLLGRVEDAKRTLFKAATQAKSTDSLLNVAIECAKHGYDALTLVLTRRILKREPYHLRAMAMRACALMNLGSFQKAKKLFDRLRLLMPEGDIFEGYYSLAQMGKPCDQRLTMAQDVTQEEAMNRSMQILSFLQEDPALLRSDPQMLMNICRIASWAIHSPLAGANVTLISVIMLVALDMPETRAVLFDALLSPQLDDGLKLSILQVVSEHCSVLPKYADLGGRFGCIAAGASIPLQRSAAVSQKVVQRAADVLMSRYPDAAGKLLEMWIACLQTYGPVKGRNADACSAALEYVFHLQSGRSVALAPIAKRCGVSMRLIRVWTRRILRSIERQNITFDESWRKQDEVHQF